MFLSIIVPYYNGDAVIGRCLDSIYSQGFDIREFEVICVDDCSAGVSAADAIAGYMGRNTPPPVTCG